MDARFREELAGGRLGSSSGVLLQSAGDGLGLVEELQRWERERWGRLEVQGSWTAGQCGGWLHAMG